MPPRQQQTPLGTGRPRHQLLPHPCPQALPCRGGRAQHPPHHWWQCPTGPCLAQQRAAGCRSAPQRQPPLPPPHAPARAGCAAAAAAGAQQHRPPPCPRGTHSHWRRCRPGSWPCGGACGARSACAAGEGRPQRRRRLRSRRRRPTGSACGGRTCRRQGRCPAHAEQHVAREHGGAGCQWMLITRPACKTAHKQHMRAICPTSSPRMHTYVHAHTPVTAPCSWAGRCRQRRYLPLQRLQRLPRQPQSCA